MLRHFLGNYFAVWLRERALLIDNVSFESVLISNSSVQDLMSCAELIISILKMVKEEMKFVSDKKLCVLKLLFLKMFILVNLLTQNAETAA